MGKHKYIETPDKLFEFFKEYEKEVKSNPRTKHVFVGKDAVSEREELERPLTIEGFYEFVCEHKDTKFDTDHPDLSDYFENKDNRYSEFVRICSRIKRRIRRDQIEGGMVGQYNPSITQRLNNLVDRSETNLKVEQPLFPDSE
jgi:hypothetical protein